MALLGGAGGGAAVTPLDDALTQLDAALDQLVTVIEGGVNTVDDLGLVGFLQRFERVRNRLPLVDHAMLGEAQARGLADRLTQPSLARVLVSSLRLSAGEAHRRVKAADALAAGSTMTGERLEPRRPVLAAAQRAGDVTPEQVQVIVRALEKVDRPGFDPADITVGERLLTGQAATFDPKLLSQLADRVVDAIDPDGTVPDEQLQADRRHFSMRTCRDGSYLGEFRLTGILGAKLTAVLKPLARPRIEHLPTVDGEPAVPAQLLADERTHGQRMHDALEDVCDRLLRAGQLPDSGGVPATVIVTITLEDLQERLRQTRPDPSPGHGHGNGHGPGQDNGHGPGRGNGHGHGHGHTSDGARLSAGQVLDLAGQADLIPTVLNRAGAVLSQGRTRRIATPSQTWALIARDAGCSFPGCHRAPELCERHHIIPWIDGGPTDLDNLTLLCRYHHHQFEQRGWTVTLNADRIPEWTPPRWIDRHQRPMTNTRIQLARLSRAQAADRGERPQPSPDQLDLVGAPSG